MTAFRILTINPGSTSTKAAVYEGKKELYSVNIVHDPEKLDEFNSMAQQAPFRRDAVLSALASDGQPIDSFDAIVGVGGVGLAGVPYGTYAVNDIMLKDATEGTYAVHPNNLGVIIAHELADACACPAFAAGMASSEEFQDVAHVGGFAQTPRRCCVHMLNTKEVALRHASSLGKRYDQMNLVIAHVGGGITVAAHKQGKVVDGTDGVDQEGPMTPNRPGSVRLISFMKLISGMDPADAKKLVSQQGGLTSHLGTNDVLKVKEMIAAGDEYAKLVYDALLYQVGNWIGYMASVLHGQVDGIILTGGLMKDDYAVQTVTKQVEWIAPVSVYPGELEGEALAAAAERVLSGEEALLEYSGVPVWTGFEAYRRAQ